MDEEGHEFLETYDPTILRGQVRTERVAAVPSPLRGIVLSIMRQVGAAAVAWDRLQVAMHPGLAIRALERDDYEAIAADAPGNSRQRASLMPGCPRWPGHLAGRI